MAKLWDLLGLHRVQYCSRRGILLANKGSERPEEEEAREE